MWDCLLNYYRKLEKKEIPSLEDLQYRKKELKEKVEEVKKELEVPEEKIEEQPEEIKQAEPEEPKEISAEPLSEEKTEKIKQDLEIIKRVGFSCCPSNAQQIIKKNSVFISSLKGGEGFVREICNIILDLY